MDHRKATTQRVFITLFTDTNTARVLRFPKLWILLEQNSYQIASGAVAPAMRAVGYVDRPAIRAAGQRFPFQGRKDELGGLAWRLSQAKRKQGVLEDDELAAANAIDRGDLAGDD